MAIEPFVKCSDLRTSIEFYTKVLDFELRVAPNPDPAAFDSKHAVLAREDSLVHLSSHSGDGVFGTKLYVRVADLRKLYESCVASGLNTQDRDSPPALRGGPVEQSWGMREFWVHDPDRNIITFGEPT